MQTTNIELPKVVTRTEWLVVRQELLAKEKELIRHRDALNAERRRLTALGRQEDWEEPKGRATGLGAPAGSDKIVYPDEYEE